MRPRPARPLLADSARPRAIVLLAGCVILVAVLGTVFARQTTADAFDRAVDSPVITWFAHRQDSAGWLSFAGTPIPAAGLTAVIVAACLLAGRLTGAVLAAAAVPVATVLNETLIKPLVHRTYLGQVVYPSGHATTIFALAATVTVLILGAPRRLRVPILTVTYTAAAAVVVGVIGLRYHYFTDTVAGAAVGTGTVFWLALILDLIHTARPVGHPDDHVGRS